MHTITVNIPVPYMLSSAERQAWIDATLNQKSLQFEDIEAEVIDTVYDVPYDVVKMKLQLTDEQHNAWLEALSKPSDKFTVEIKQYDQ